MENPETQRERAKEEEARKGLEARSQAESRVEAGEKRPCACQGRVEREGEKIAGDRTSGLDSCSGLWISMRIKKERLYEKEEEADRMGVKSEVEKGRSDRKARVK